MTTPTPRPVDHDEFMALGEQCLRLAEVQKNTSEALLKTVFDVLLLKCVCLLLLVGMIALGSITVVLFLDRPAATTQESRP